jgi:uncharacterized protein (DUF1800 family)
MLMRCSCLAYCALSLLIPALTACSSLQISATESLAFADRVTWGANSDSLRQIHAAGAERYLEQQLQPSTNTSLPSMVQQQIDALEISRKPMPVLTASLELQRKNAEALLDPEQKKQARQAYWQHLSLLGRETAQRSLLRDLYSPHQLQEQMTWFWVNHFSVYQDKNGLRTMLADYEDQIRRHALGRFRDLLGVSAHHPAMLLFLDNQQNTLGHLNENYARELMELHTLGVDGGYSQRDVQELARVLSGLGIRYTQQPPRLSREQLAQYRRWGLVEFNPAQHDYGSKVFLGQPLHTRGAAELDEVLDRLARHPATARFLCRKLAQYLVGDDPARDLLDAMTQRYLQTDGQISEVLRTMFHSAAFRASLGKKYKDPVHYLVSAVRLAYDGKTVRNTAPMLNWLNRMGEPLYGHSTPEGYLLTEAAWSSPGQMTTRIEIARTIGSNSAGLFRSEGPTPHEDAAFPQLANALFYQFGQVRLSQASRSALQQAQPPQEWNMLLLSSPEFMYR